ncbi:hypothetical protein BH23ACT12_BH23ACT12_08840 [soil metagenome]
MNPSIGRIGAAGLLASGATLLAGAGLLVSRGRMHVDLGWGRSLHSLGPTEVVIDAPRDLVFQQISGPYLGRVPAALKDKIKVLERSETMVVAEHRTPMPLMDAVTVEAVGFEPPGRITFRLLRGPVPHVTEEFVLEEAESGTRLTYRGELGADLWVIGRFYGTRLVRPVWEATVAGSLEGIKKGAEKRAASQRKREEREKEG